MKIPDGVTITAAGRTYRAGEDWPDGVPVPEHLQPAATPPPADAAPPRRRDRE